jgi:nondiscriminating glutamyl-tRNA synthetase
MGVLPEALTNYLALLGWAPSGGTREIFSREELVKEFSLQRVTPSPAVFDMEKLYWLNRHYIKQMQIITSSSADGSTKSSEAAPNIQTLALPYFVRAALLPEKTDATVAAWFSKLLNLIAPSVDRLEQLPDRASLIFSYDAKAALTAPDNAETLAGTNTDAVITRFTVKILADESALEHRLTPECFKQLVNEVKAETGAKGKELFHPIRIIITGSHSGPEFDRLIPILEEGSRLNLPSKVLSVYERVEAFAKAKS